MPVKILLRGGPLDGEVVTVSEPPPPQLSIPRPQSDWSGFGRATYRLHVTLAGELVSVYQS